MDNPMVGLTPEEAFMELRIASYDTANVVHSTDDTLITRWKDGFVLILTRGSIICLPEDKLILGGAA